MGCDPYNITQTSLHSLYLTLVVVHSFVNVLSSNNEEAFLQLEMFAKAIAYNDKIY